MRELVVLGTSSQVPTRARNHNGYFLRWDGDGLLFDPGEGTQRQMIHAGVASSQVTRICLTHVHGDHCFGLPGVLARMAVDQVTHPVHLHYPASGEETVRALTGLAGAGPDLRWHPHGGAGDVADGLEVAPLRHRVETYGYRVREPDGRTLLPDLLTAAGITGLDVGRLQREGQVGGVRLADVSVPRRGQSFALVMDTAVCDGARRLAEGTDVVVMESTFADEEAGLAAEYGHLTAGQAGALASEAGAGLLVLTHFSSRYADVAPLREQAQARAGATRVVAAADLDRYAFPRRRELRRRTSPGPGA
ncbi:ribonuclease Z [Georgenia deserti]|uniref:Ribonuclease Z n=1 Tax=Georgenia deserti TaxID=2093781 RepID=A0ABW4L728_9MICO